MKFININDIYEYVREGIRIGRFTPEEVRKIGQGEAGETVPVLAVQIGRNKKRIPGIVFTNKYGEEMRVEGDGHLVFYDGARGVLGQGTYGVAEEAWDTYEPTGKSQEEALEESMDLLGLDYVKGKDGQILRGIEVLELPLNVEMALNKIGINTIHDLIQLTEYELIADRDVRIHNLIRSSLDKIETFLAEQGLSLQPEEVQGRIRLEDEGTEESLIESIKRTEKQMAELPKKLEALKKQLAEHQEKMKEHGLTPAELANDDEARSASEEFERQAQKDNLRDEIVADGQDIQ